MNSVSPPKSPLYTQLKLMWRLLRLTFWLSAVTALLYILAGRNVRQMPRLRSIQTQLPLRVTKTSALRASGGISCTSLALDNIEGL